MYSIVSDSIGDAWVEYLSIILKNGTTAFDARENIREVLFVNIELDVQPETDPIIEKFGDKHVIEMYRSKMFSTDIIEELNSTYGDRFFSLNGFNQIEDVVARLRDNPWAKSCFLPLVVPNDPGPRIPCLSAVQFACRGDELLLFSTFRSQNVFNAYGNFLGLRDIQKHVADELSIAQGKLYISINFPHIYESNIHRAREIVRVNSGKG